MASSANFSVGTGAAVLLATGGDDSTELTVLLNTANALYLGGSNVSTSNGYLVGSTVGAKHTFRIGKNETVYGISGTGTLDVRVFVSNG